MSCQYHHGDLYCDITLCMETKIETHLKMNPSSLNPVPVQGHKCQDREPGTQLTLVLKHSSNKIRVQRLQSVIAVYLHQLLRDSQCTAPTQTATMC